MDLLDFLIHLVCFVAGRELDWRRVVAVIVGGVRVVVEVVGILRVWRKKAAAVVVGVVVGGIDDVVIFGIVGGGVVVVVRDGVVVVI